VQGAPQNHLYSLNYGIYTWEKSGEIYSNLSTHLASSGTKNIFNSITILIMMLLKQSHPWGSRKCSCEFLYLFIVGICICSLFIHSKFHAQDKKNSTVNFDIEKSPSQTSTLIAKSIILPLRNSLYIGFNLIILQSNFSFSLLE